MSPGANNVEVMPVVRSLRSLALGLPEAIGRLPKAAGLLRLVAGKHFKDNTVLPPVVTELHMAEKVPAPCLAPSCASSTTFSSSYSFVSTPSTAQMGRKALLLRVSAKEAATAPCASGASAVAKKQIWVKSRDPSWH